VVAFANLLADFVVPTIFLVLKPFSKNCGGDVPMFEPKVWLSIRSVDKIVRDLRRIYKENPTGFDIPAFARKVY